MGAMAETEIGFVGSWNNLPESGEMEVDSGAGGEVGQVGEQPQCQA